MITLSRLKGIETLDLPSSSGRQHALITLSRLKGIETHQQGCQWCVACEQSLITLSRLKGIETIYPTEDGRHHIPLITLSRLKGIETFARSALFLGNDYFFDYAFPFEGN